jgi:hypothetical protein
VASRGFGIALFLLTPLVWFFGEIQSQTSSGGHWNTTQLILTNLVAASLILTGVLLAVYGSKRLSGWWIFGAVMLNVVLFVVWIEGWSHWCSGCGTP